MSRQDRTFKTPETKFLTKTEVELLRLRINYEGKPKTFEEIGEIYEVTGSQIRNKLSLAFKKLDIQARMRKEWKNQPKEIKTAREYLFKMLSEMKKGCFNIKTFKDI
jgi:DNA-directed RNA polymerase sigma subunit (sigma70/sigma32)